MALEARLGEPESFTENKRHLLKLPAISKLWTMDVVSISILLDLRYWNITFGLKSNARLFQIRLDLFWLLLMTFHLHIRGFSYSSARFCTWTSLFHLQGPNRLRSMICGEPNITLIDCSNPSVPVYLSFPALKSKMGGQAFSYQAKG